MIYDPLDIWNSLGTAWENFQNKPIIEALWSGLAVASDTVNNYVLEIQKSRSLLYMNPLLDLGPETFTIIFSGLATDVNVTPIYDGQHLFSYEVGSWTYSIPQITTNYKYLGVAYSHTYNEGIDYTISGLNYIVWNETPPASDVRNSTDNVLYGYVPHMYLINPVLMEVWARFCGLQYSDFVQYNTFGQSAFTHLKMLIWALVYKQTQAPSIKTLRDALAISRGMPFTYTSGITSSVNSGSYYTVTVGTNQYVLPPGLLPIADGTVVAQFDVIAEGVDLYDNATSPAIVNSYANVYNANNTLVYDIGNAASTLSYSSAFANTYMAKLWPIQLQVILQTVIMGSHTIFMDNQYIYMDSN